MELNIDGECVLIDDEDIGLLGERTWRIRISGGKKYVYAKTTKYDKTKGHNHKTIMIHLHRIIHPIGHGLFIDHINGNTLDNRKTNLRECTQQQNMWNMRISSKNTTGYKGVCYCASKHKYVAAIHFNNKKRHIGYYKTAEEAHNAYKAKAIELFGEYANFG